MDIARTELLEQINHMDTAISVQNFFIVDRKYFAAVSASYLIFATAHAIIFPLQMVSACSAYVGIYTQFYLSEKATR